MIKLMQHKFRYGDLSLDKDGFEVDRERAVLPTIVFAQGTFMNDRIITIGAGWWKWGIRIIMHVRVR